MARKRNPVLIWVLTSLSLTFSKITAVLPLSLCRTLGRFIGSVAYLLVPRIRTVGLANLDRAYGDTLPDAEKRRILKEATQNLGIVAAEFSHIPALFGGSSPPSTRIEGLEHIDPERGTLLIGGHLGNWEWMAPALSQAGLQVAEIVRPLDDPRLDRLVDSTRRSGNIETIGKDGAGKEVLRLLREGWVVGVLVDQSPRENGVPTRFFGQECWGTIAPAMIAARAKVPIHTAAMIRDAHGQYTLTFSPPFELVKSGDFRKDLVDNTQHCQDLVEADVRAHPGQWLWMHRRWKPRPRLAAEWDARKKR